MCIVSGSFSARAGGVVGEEEETGTWQQQESVGPLAVMRNNSPTVRPKRTDIGSSAHGVIVVAFAE